MEIAPGVRVVQDVDLVSHDPACAGTMRWEADGVEEGTRVEIRADDVPAGISAEEHAAGLASSPAHPARHLQG